MKYIKYLIIFFIILIMLLIALLSIFDNNGEIENKTNKIQNDNLNKNLLENEIANIPEDTDYTQKVDIDNTLNYIQDRSTYFTISALYDNYINLLANKDSYILMNILSPRYISTYSITDKNVFEELSVPQKDNEKQYYKNIITDILEVQVDSNIYLYIVKGKSRIVGKDVIFSTEVMFELDNINNIYNVYPYQYMKDNGFSKLTEGNKLVNYDKEEIADRINNKFNYITKTDLQMAEEYFNNYKELLKYYKQDAYNKLNIEYSKKRFGNESNFQSYLKDNYFTLALMSIDKYEINSYNNYTDYVCSDKYENIYIFRQQGGIMRYSVFLDNYTVMSEKELKEYNELDEFDKSKYNLTKFINMVNTKDYNTIYKVLDATFKNNNFKSVEDLKKYIENNLYDLNSIEVEEYDDENYTYYVFECNVTNMKNINQNKNMTVVIKQAQGLEFTMSFSFE